MFITGHATGFSKECSIHGVHGLLISHRHFLCLLRQIPSTGLRGTSVADAHMEPSAQPLMKRNQYVSCQPAPLDSPLAMVAARALGTLLSVAH